METDVHPTQSTSLDRLWQRAEHFGALDAVAAFGLFAGVVVAARLFADLGPADTASSWLLAAAIGSKLPLVIAGVVALGLAFRFSRGSLFLTWSDLDRGTALQRLTGVILALMVWRFLSAEFDFAWGQWWALDRIGLLVLAAISLRYPVALLAVVLQARLLQAPIRTAFGLASGATLDDLPILALAALGSIAFLAALTGKRDTHLLVPLLAASTVAQFFISGRAKLRIGWLFDNDLSNFPLNGYQQGWLSNGDGQLADALSSFFATFRWPLLLGTLLIELGAVVMLARRRSLIFAVASFAAFHLFVFLGYGFSFLEWAVVEIGLIILLLGAVGREWSAPSFRAAPIALAAIFVVFGGFVMKPPTLAWFDGPITYGYEIEATDVNGEVRQLTSQDFAPHESAFAFAFLHLGPTKPVAAGYGALNRQRMDDLTNVANWNELAPYEEPHDRDWRTDRTIANLEQFIASSGRSSGPFDWLPNAPTRYNTSRLGDAPEEGIAFEHLAITRVTLMRVEGETLERREPVLELRRADDGTTETIWAS